MKTNTDDINALADAASKAEQARIDAAHAVMALRQDEAKSFRSKQDRTTAIVVYRANKARIWTLDMFLKHDLKNQDAFASWFYRANTGDKADVKAAVNRWQYLTRQGRIFAGDAAEDTGKGVKALTAESADKLIDKIIEAGFNGQTLHKLATKLTGHYNAVRATERAARVVPMPAAETTDAAPLAATGTDR